MRPAAELVGERDDGGTVGEDQHEISRTLGTYCQRCDDGDFDALVDLFTEDARLAFEQQVAEGHDAIRTLMEKVQPAEARGKHITSNSLVDIDGDTATATTDYLFVRPGAGGLSVVASGRYYDSLVRQGERWRFSERMVTIVVAGGGGSDG